MMISIGGLNDDHLEGGDGVSMPTISPGAAATIWLEGGDGDDFLEGGAGERHRWMVVQGTTALAMRKPLAVSPSTCLVTPLCWMVTAHEDTIISIEQFELSEHDDQFIGDGANNVVDGGAGDDTIERGRW